MKTLRLFFLCLAVAALFAAGFPSRAHAWWWSDYATVKVPVKSSGILMVDSVNCKSATLYGSGRSYSASVSNPWLSNNCTFTFSNVYVKYSGWYTLTYRYTYLFTTGTRSVSVYVAKPALSSTYTTSTVTLKP